MESHLSRRSVEIAELTVELEKLQKRLAAIDPICEYFIKMCKLALLEHDPAHMQ